MICQNCGHESYYHTHDINAAGVSTLSPCTVWGCECEALAHSVKPETHEKNRKDTQIMKKLIAYTILLIGGIWNLIGLGTLRAAFSQDELWAIFSLIFIMLVFVLPGTLIGVAGYFLLKWKPKNYSQT